MKVISASKSALVIAVLLVGGSSTAPRSLLFLVLLPPAPPATGWCRNTKVGSPVRSCSANQDNWCSPRLASRVSQSWWLGSQEAPNIPEYMQAQTIAVHHIRQVCTACLTLRSVISTTRNAVTLAMKIATESGSCKRRDERSTRLLDLEVI